MKPEEIETAKKNTGKTPKEFIVGYDALAIYVNKDESAQRDYPRPDRADL